MNTLYGFKKEQSQDYDSKGMRVPITWVKVEPTTVIATKTMDQNKYDALQIAFGTKKNLNKPISGLLKNLPEPNSTEASLGKKISPRFIREIKLDKLEELDKFAIGSKIQISDVFVAGDKVNVTGTSLGKGFAGVMKRHKFHGGNRTHGQSVRPRHPGSIGAGTTPGRVYKGKRMAGHMGNAQATVRNLEIFKVLPEENTILIRGLVPGHRGSLVKVTKLDKLV